jgi:predicted CXXCH cytochrome family protein
MSTGTCVVCHSNHAILKTSDQLLGGKNAVCGECHDADSAGGKTAAQAAGLIQDLQNRIVAADAILEQARTSGMEVSEAILRQTDARQNLVKARANVHAFAIAEVSQPVEAGLAIAAQDYRAGEAALKEKYIRRMGLAISLAAILVTMLGLWLIIRWLHAART